MDTQRNSRIGELRQATAILLDSDLPASSLRPEVLVMVDVLRQATADRFKQEHEISKGETRTRSGLCLSPTMAAMCADDYVRTIMFLRGVNEAIADVRNAHPDRPAQILYVGCGPFGALALPLMTVFESSEALFTLLDIHADSINSVDTAVCNLGLNHSVSGTIVTDAMSYRIDPAQAPDIIVIEVMQACLEAEPQVELTRNLMSQAPNAVIVPEEVRVDLRLVDPSLEFVPDRRGRDRLPLGSVFHVNRSPQSWSARGDGDLIPGGNVTIPDPLEARFQPMLFTTIKVYGDHVLDEYSSGLTCPKVLKTDDPIRAGANYQFSYVLGKSPHLRCQEIKG